jgi:hypothetical protein
MVLISTKRRVRSRMRFSWRRLGNRQHLQEAPHPAMTLRRNLDDHIILFDSLVYVRQSRCLKIETSQSHSINTPLSAAIPTNAMCTTTESAALVPPPAAGALELAVALEEVLEVEVLAAVAPRVVSSSPGESRLISCEVGPATAELPSSVSRAVVVIAVGLGAASSRLASVVASAGVENVMVLLKSAKRAEAWRSSLAVVV